MRTEAERESILQQLERLVASPVFRNSKRYCSLLKYLVEQTLEGRAENLKERTLGVEVFGRQPDYDTNVDHSVRSAVGEIRKRLAQYYLEPGHESEVRIEVQSGSYVPRFRMGPDKVMPELHLERVAVAAPAPRSARRFLVPAVILAAVAAVTAAGLTLRPADYALKQFWEPVWGTSEPVLLCLGGGNPRPQQASTAAAAAAPDGPSVIDVMRSDRIPFADALTLARLTGLLQQHGKTFEIRRGASSGLTELRRGPAILIGAFNNAWTMRLEGNLRFTFVADPATRTTGIRDRLNPAQPAWKTDPTQPYSQFQEDFAIVSRFLDPLTEKTVVVVAGMTQDGTMAAGEFVTNARYLEALARRGPGGWARKNLQVVLATEVVNAVPGPPRVLATHFW